MDRRRITFLNPVLSLPWCYCLNDGILQNLENIGCRDSCESILVDGKTGALDLRMKKRVKIASPKKLNKTIRMLKERHCKTCSARFTPSDNNNNSSSFSSNTTLSFSSTKNSKKISEVKSLILDGEKRNTEVKRFEMDEAKNRRKNTKPQKRTILTENTDPLRVFNFEEDEANALKFCSKKIKKNRPKVGVVLKLRNERYESALL